MQVGFRARVLACIVITIRNRSLGERPLNLNQKISGQQKKKGTRWGSFESGENVFTLGGKQSGQSGLARCDEVYQAAKAPTLRALFRLATPHKVENQKYGRQRCNAGFFVSY
jgi:hypothetical protein